MNMSREELKSLLKSNIMVVNFTKKNGETRQMFCTLQERYLPVPTEKEKARKENPEVLAAWDIWKGEFRSFRLDSVIGEPTINKGVIPNASSL